jgi:anti-anti-sigma factor
MTVHGDDTELGWDGHLVLLPGSEDDRRARLSSWVRSGLDRGEQVVYAEDSRIPADRSVLAVLDEHGVGTAKAIANGALVLVSMDEVSTPGGWRALAERGLANHPAVRLSTEPCGGGVLPQATLAALDRDIDELCRALPVSVLCQYGGPIAAGEPFDGVAGFHRGGVRDRQLHTAVEDGTLILAGEVDLANEAVLAPVLRSATAGAGRTLAVDLRRLVFLSVGGCRVLATATAAYRQQGGCVELRSPQWIVERAMRMFGLDDIADMEVAGSGW